MRPPPDPLDAVLAIDELEVGPVELAARRLRAPYAVVSGGRRETTELRYRWEEDVFDPEDPLSRNLASLIGSQVALNYGLFCRRIVLRGPFDAVDRRFLAEALENTAREIYVKKLLEPNPFLEGQAAALEPERPELYARAELAFPDRAQEVYGCDPAGHGSEDAAGEPSARCAAWVADRRRHAVLSSGGKDSLLTLGLLEEAGVEVHSVFVNESGRHWYTALNAYRHLARTRPARTVRVWTTADRLFAWMLRRLPFVRRDFARVRSDEYPIRLWTVAVFLFGALPVLRRRGIGRLAIGDEFDTSRRLRRDGVSHYDGLYDQSRWFDDALSRFYAQKGWPLVQFSLLRPASELLVQKTLVERYPELQRHQVSCHAASIRGDRVFPCGRCEKCRRIVGMLLALDADPGGCGYGEEEARACLSALARDGVHQEAAGAEQLAWMLASRGLLADAGPGRRRARERPEVLRLRFHEDAAPVDGIPVDLRRPVWTALLEHAEGALHREGRRWEPFEPLASEALRRPYRFEGPTGGSDGTHRPGDDPDESAGAGRDVPWFVHTGRISPSGVLGTPPGDPREEREDLAADGGAPRAVRGGARGDASGSDSREGTVAGRRTAHRRPAPARRPGQKLEREREGGTMLDRRSTSGGGTPRPWVFAAALAVLAPLSGHAQEAGSPEVEYLVSNAMSGLDLPFSEAVRVGELLFLSGQIGILPGEGRVVEGGIGPETRQTMENIRATLERFGSSLDRVVKCTVMLADIGEWEAMNEVYRTYFPEGRRPARSALGASGLALDARVEVECIATVER